MKNGGAGAFFCYSFCSSLCFGVCWVGWDGMVNGLVGGGEWAKNLVCEEKLKVDGEDA